MSSHDTGFTAEPFPPLEETSLPATPPPEAPPQPGLGWSIIWCIGFVIFTQGPAAVVAIVVLAALMLTRPDLLPPGDDFTPKELMQSRAFDVSMMAAFAVAELLVIGFSLLVIRLVVGRDWPRQLGLRLPGLGHTLMALAAFPGLVLLANASYTLLRQGLHLPTLTELFDLPNMEEMVGVFSRWDLSLAVLIIGLGPGIGEELWCRGFLGRGLVGRYGPVLGVLLTSFFFGLIHLDPCQGAMAAILGLVLHFVYLTSRSLYLPILLHFLNNSLAVTASRFSGLQAVEKDPGSIPLVVYFAGVGLLLTAGWGLYVSRVRLVDEGDRQQPWRPPFPGAVWPPADGGVCVERPNTRRAYLVVGVAFLVFVAVCAGAYILTR